MGENGSFAPLPAVGDAGVSAVFVDLLSFLVLVVSVDVPADGEGVGAEGCEPAADAGADPSAGLVGADPDGATPPTVCDGIFNF